MSFRCGFCSKTQPARTSPVLVVTEYRHHNHPERKNKETNKVFDPGGSGRQIVKEVLACEKCAPKDTVETAQVA